MRHHEYRVVRYPGDRLPFEAGSFDCIISNAVLQELPLPLEQFSAEMARVLKPGGLIDLEWHNFYSWSGHYKGELESRRLPWGHLRGGPFHPCLNQVTPTQVEAAFAEQFSETRLLGHDRHYHVRGKDPAFEPEGAADLTSDLAAELARYPQEWLLTRGYILQGRRKA